MDSIKLLQPTIIRFNDSEELPKLIRNKYALNVNIPNIEYFEKECMMLEVGGGMILKESPKREHVHMFLEKFGTDTFDIPRFIVLMNPNKPGFYIENFKEFIRRAIEEPILYIEGVPGFRLGIDYYINETMAVLLDSLYPGSSDKIFNVPNYLDSDGNLNSKYYKALDQLEQDYTNYHFYITKNQILDHGFEEDDIRRLCSTFPQTILDFTQIDYNAIITKKNQIYDKILKYFQSNQTDCVTQGIELILNQTEVGIPTNTATTTQKMMGECGTCTTTSNDNSQNGNSCLSLYREAMNTILKSMLADKEFYIDWMTYQRPDGTYPFEELIDKLKNLIVAYGELKPWKSFSPNIVKKGLGCNCPTIQGASDDSNITNALNNYLKVLCWVECGELDENTNKIRIYGQEFASILPTLCN